MPKSRPFVASPVKKRDPKKSQAIVHLKRVEQRRKYLQEQISQLLNPPNQLNANGDASQDASDDDSEMETLTVNVGECQLLFASALLILQLF